MVKPPEAEVRESAAFGAGTQRDKDKELIPLTLTTPDGVEIGGKRGKLLAFLAYEEAGWTPKRRDMTAQYLYGVVNKQTNAALSALITMIKRVDSTASKNGVIIKSQIPPREFRRKGARAFDWLSLVAGPEVDAEEEVEVLDKGRLQAAVLADMMLRVYQKDSAQLEQLGVNLGQAGIKELQGIRQQGGVIKPELRSRLIEDGQALLLRFFADMPVVYDELAQNPDYKNTLIALSHFTPLAQSEEAVFGQLFKE